MTDTVEDFLAHYGVKGMRWGVVHEVDSDGMATKTVDKEKSKQDKREAKAQKFEKQAANVQTRIDQLNTTDAKTTYAKYVKDTELKDLTKIRNQALSDAEAKRQGKLTSTQKKVIIGAAVTAVVIGAVVIRGNIENGEFNRLAMKGQAFLEGKKGLSFKVDDKLSKKMSADEVFENVVKPINPNYGAVGTKNNCRRATFTYEMRRRGYDVKATRTSGGSGQTVAGYQNATTPGKFRSTNKFALVGRLSKEAYADSTKTGKPTPLMDLGKNGPSGARNPIPSIDLKGKLPKQAMKVVPADAIHAALSKEPDGSRGELVVKWLGGGGHSVAYEIFDGKPVIFDTQSGAKYDSVEAVKAGIGAVESAGFTRLDNIPLNTDYLGRWMKNTK